MLYLKTEPSLDSRNICLRAAGIVWLKPKPGLVGCFCKSQTHVKREKTLHYSGRLYVQRVIVQDIYEAALWLIHSLFILFCLFDMLNKNNHHREHQLKAESVNMHMTYMETQGVDVLLSNHFLTGQKESQNYDKA